MNLFTPSPESPNADLDRDVAADVATAVAADSKSRILKRFSYFLGAWVVTSVILQIAAVASQSELAGRLPQGIETAQEVVTGLLLAFTIVTFRVGLSGGNPLFSPLARDEAFEVYSFPGEGGGGGERSRRSLGSQPNADSVELALGGPDREMGSSGTGLGGMGGMGLGGQRAGLQKSARDL